MVCTLNLESVGFHLLTLACQVANEVHFYEGTGQNLPPGTEVPSLSKRCETMDPTELGCPGPVGFVRIIGERING